MAESQVGRSLQGPVAVLCNVRLAALALATVVLAAAEDTSWVDLAVLMAALPFSFWPLRRTVREPVLRVSAVFAVADGAVVLAVLVVSGLDSLALGYVAASLVVAALWRGAAATWWTFAALAALHLVALMDGVATTGTQVAGVLARLLLFAAVAYAGVRLRELLLSRERLDTLVQTERVRAASEAERTRLAREMHDSLSKTLHGTHLLATVLATRLRAQGSDAADEVQVIAQAVDTARQDARRLLVELREELVEDLPAHLRRLTEQWAGSAGVELELDLPPVAPPLSPTAREELSRAVGELLANVGRHAHASRVVVSLHVVAGAAELAVRDDGTGMPAPDLAVLYRTGHFGLIGVRERMARIGGTLAVRDVQPRGTDVILTAPLDGAVDWTPPLVTGVVPSHPVPSQTEPRAGLTP